MAILRCKMCGGDIKISENQSIGTCEYCGCSVTIPKYESEEMLEKFNKGNDYRIEGKFEQAQMIYDDLVMQDSTNPEAYWGRVLVKYGIEYVEDPVTLERKPTCYRIVKESILGDSDYKKVIEYSDGVAKRIYEREARKINEIVKKIITISEKEEPYDVFISYKETSEFGERTEDSVIAQDIYTKLTEDGYRVFFSRISLESVLGEEYEPYIFSALNSAKVMIVIGTNPDIINSSWVKNEWGRYLQIMKNSREKILIPCVKGFSPNMLPEKLRSLQAQDLNKMGALQDLIYGINKVLKKEEAVETRKNEIGNTKLERAFQLIEDSKFEDAERILNSVLEEDVACAKAYIGLLLCEMELNSEEELQNCDTYYGLNKNFERALKFASSEYREKLKAYEEKEKEYYANDCSNIADDYEVYKEEFYNPEEYTRYEYLAKSFKEIIDEVGSWKDAEKLYNACLEKIQTANDEKERILKRNRGYNAYVQNRLVLKGDTLLGIQYEGIVSVAGKDAESIRKKVNSWKDIAKIQISDDKSLIAAIKEDGTFLSTSILITQRMGTDNKYVDIKVGDDCVVGITTEGTVRGYIDDQVFSPNDWIDIKKIDCSGNTVAAIDKDGRLFTNIRNVYEQIIGYKELVCYKENIYVIDNNNDAYCVTKKGEYRQFKDIDLIKIINGKLFGINKEGACICEEPTSMTVRRKTGFFTKEELPYEFYFDWSKELIDVGILNNNLLGVKYDGTVWYSQKEVTNIDGVDYFDYLEKRIEDTDEAVAMFVSGENVVTVLQDGRVITTNKAIDVSRWRLFDNEEQADEDYSLNTTLSQLLKGIDRKIDELMKRVEDIEEMPYEQRIEEIGELKQILQLCKEIDNQLVHIPDNVSEVIKEKLEQLKISVNKAIKTDEKGNQVHYCTKCGNMIRPGKKFCSKCGAMVER